MVDPVSREPVDGIDLHLQVIHGATADVFEPEGFSLLRAFVAHGADQPGTASASEGEHGQEVGFIQVHMQLAIERRAGAIDVGDIKHLLVRAAGKADVECLAHGGASTVAAGQVAGLAAV
ncbi:hypothetical protein D3C72_1902480 [compost metagenome]